MFQQFDSFGYFDPNQELFPRDLSKVHGQRMVMISTPSLATGFYKRLLKYHIYEQEQLIEEDTILEQASLDTEME